MRLPRRECENQFPWGFLGLWFGSPSCEPIRRCPSLSDLSHSRWEQVRQRGEEKARPNRGHCESEEDGGRAPKPAPIPITDSLESGNRLRILGELQFFSYSSRKCGFCFKSFRDSNMITMAWVYFSELTFCIKSDQCFSNVSTYQNHLKSLLKSRSAGPTHLI